MRRNYDLQPLTATGTPLRFTWDPDTGDVTGPDAERVLELVADAERRGTVIGDPHPTVFDVNDPLTNEADMALVIGQGFVLPDDLRAAYPATDQEGDIPEDAIC